MNNDRDHPDHLQRWLSSTKPKNLALSDSSGRGSAPSIMSVTSIEGRAGPFASSLSSSKTNSVAMVTAEEPSGDQALENEFSPTLSDCSTSNRSDDHNGTSHSQSIHAHKRRKKVHINSSTSSEESEKAYSFSSSLLYKRGTVNTNVKTFISLERNQKENNVSVGISGHCGLSNSFSRAHDQREDGYEIDQNNSGSSVSSHDAALSKLSTVSQSPSIRLSPADAYKSFHSSPPPDKSDEGDDKERNSERGSAATSPKVGDCAVQTYVDLSASITGNTNTSTIRAHKKEISALQMHQTSSICSSASSIKFRKEMIGNVLQTYQSTLASTMINTNKDKKAGKESVEVGDKTEKQVDSSVPSSLPSSFTSPSGTADKVQKGRAITLSTVTSNGGIISSDNGSMLTLNSLPSSTLSTDLISGALQSNISKCMYQDYSHITPDEVAMDEMKRGYFPCAQLNKDLSFPQKLHQILLDPEVQNWITWLPHGRAWKVINKKKFVEVVLHRYFRHGNFKSFTRQVNIWGFKRILSGPDEKAYYHEYFLRGLQHISLKMRRKASGKLKERMQSVFTQMQLTPDFYQISKEFPLPS